MSWPLAGSREGRLYGVDLARFVALIGMALVHILPTRDDLGHTELAGWIANGRASALFAVLAGVGIALASGGARPERARPWWQLATGMLIRCVILVALGLWLAGLSDVGVYVILAYYGVLFALAVPFLRLRAVPLAVLAAACAVAMPVLQYLLIPHLPVFDGSQPTFPTLVEDPWRVTTYVLVTGVYPVLPWLTYLFAGMAAGRLPLGRRDVQLRLALGGLALAAVAWAGSWLLLTAGGIAGRLPEVAEAGVPVSDLVSGDFYGSTYTSTWWWLVVVSPHSSTPFDLVHTTGFAFAVLGSALLLCGAVGRVGRWLLAAPVAAGSMTLTLYTVHVLALRETAGNNTMGLWLVHVAVALAVGLAWRLGFPRGPVEQVVHWASWGWLPRRQTGSDPARRNPAATCDREHQPQRGRSRRPRADECRGGDAAVTIRVALEHRTTYTFDRLVNLAPHVVRLRPAPHCRTPISAYSLRVKPEQHFLNWQQDAFGNHLARLVFPERTRELEVVVGLVADMTVINPFDFFVESSAERYPFAYDPATAADLEPYLRPVGEGLGSAPGPGPLARQWLADHVTVPADGVPIVNFLFQVNQALQRDIGYTVRLEPGVQSPDETLRLAIGSCRDSAWLLVSMLRQLGLAARFVSGYLVQLASDVPALDGPSGPTADFTDLHAWAEVYVPGAGWLGLDPTSGLFAGEGHIPLSATPHPATSAPISGAVDPAEVTLDFSNTVRRIHEDPRVTRPYAPEQWDAVDALGRRVDELLDAGDVRLTMGGEPTFVSVDDMEAEEWTVDADGPHKRERATDLAARLKERWAPHGMVHRGQGKWYPGEPLPRWAIALTWRKDGEPLWSDPALLADPWASGEATAEDAARLASALVDALGAPVECCLPAYEDTFARLLDEARLPVGDPPSTDADASDEALRVPAARADLVAKLDAEAGAVAGWVLPLHRSSDGERWATTRWRFRRGRLILLAGDSPIGYRLPLASIAWEPPPDVPERAAMAALPPLPEAPDARVRPLAVVPVEKAPTTALAVQERDGHIFVFLPPLSTFEDAVELVARVEQAAARTGLPVVVEGYPLPADPRIATLSVTPDPGVIEVNVHPTASWPELVHVLATLHEDARLARLATETFSIDGSHSGTGGGNHLTLGGTTPADSPLLRRPDLLVSMLTYWQHHPSLSYLFSGRFIGPTSQAPRADEGRPETLYELEIAFAEIERLGPEALPWQVDRALRHLLTDITGNTHRAEFCIDKLFSPDSERGRLGLLELRGFEMPPHPQMALVQALLVRALVARFWREPYTAPLVRWGSELHDRFLLPEFVSADIAAVIDDLRSHDLAFELAWLAPFLEFRFPPLGTAQVGEVTLELRSAIEPWQVLGEETSTGGTARYVDSSVERVQVSADGLVPERQILTCNGIPVPLRPTATAGRTVAGVRFRAWQPWSALHPTIGVHSPLVFDVIDRASAQSLGGFTYHVMHPGGRSYDTFPVNANEAEARRSRRFETVGHTPGAVDVSRLDDLELRQARVGAEQPRTLDLRRFPTDA